MQSCAKKGPIIVDPPVNGPTGTFGPGIVSGYINVIFKAEGVDTSRLIGANIYIALSADSLRNKQYFTQFQNPRYSEDSGMVQYRNLQFGKKYFFMASYDIGLGGQKTSPDTAIIAGKRNAPTQVTLFVK